MIAAKPSNIPLPTESTDKKKGLVSWGKRNEYPYYINYLFKNNPIHAGIIRAKRYFTVSGGLIYTGAEQIRYDEFFKNRKDGHQDKDLEGIIADISLDFEKSNMACFRVLFNAVGEKKYKKLEVIPFERIRYEVIFDEDNNEFLSGNILVSADWLEAKATWEVLQPFNKLDLEQRECYVLFQEESGQSIDTPDSKQVNPAIYPNPPYGGAITDIDTGIQIGVYNNSEIYNNFSLGAIINLNNGVPTDDKVKRDLERDLGAASTGALQAGRSMILYNNGSDNASTVTNLNGNNLADRYANTKNGSEKSTIYGHQVVVPSLFGMQQDGSFNASELEVGYAIMQANYFTGRRDEILSVLNWIMNTIAEITGAITFGEVLLNLPKETTNPQFQVNLGEQKQKEETDTILERFKLLGQDKSKFEILHSVKMGAELLSKEDLLNDYKKTFAGLSDLHQQTLNLIKEGQGYNAIRKALDISGVDLARIYQDLSAQNFITSTGEMTTQGNKQVAISEVEKIEIMYEYRERPNAPALVQGGESREFCTTLLGLNRLYTIDDINRISGMEGYNVFAYRGGWYTVPKGNANAGQHQPGCRHEWAQVITFKN